MTDPKLQEYMAQTVYSFAEAQNEIANALLRIKNWMEGAPEVQQVQLLALRRYLRKGGHQVALAWPWNDEQKRQHTEQTKAINAAAKAVMTNFKEQNPGLTLGRSQIRDLPSQIEKWCRNVTVKTAAAQLLARVLKEMHNETEYPEQPASGSLKRFKRFLSHAEVRPEPTSAAPGTSDHGQDRAVDFVVQRHGRTIADTVQSKIQKQWIEPGYDVALKNATKDTGLDGPLMKNGKLWEPWHYWLRTDVED